MRFSRLSIFLLLISPCFAADCNTAGFGCMDLNTQVKGSRLPSWGVDSGTANAYAIATIAPIGSGGVLQTGSRFMFIATHANTTASTLAVNGGSAIPIKKNVSTALAAGDIALNQVIEVTYDGTNFQLVGNGLSMGGSGTPGGSSGNIQYNNAGAFGGFADGTIDQVLHGTKIFKSIPSCVDTGGNHLNYDTSSHTWSCGTSGTGGAPSGSAGGDLGGTYPNPTVVQVNGAVVPTSATVVGTNASKQIVSASVQGNGLKVQLSTGSTTLNNCAKFDANGNVIDAGISCGTTGTAGAGFFGLWNFTTPPLTGWTWDNQGTGTTDTTNGYPYASFPTAGGVTQMRVLYRTAPSTPYTITAAILHNFGGTIGGTGNGEGGIGIGFRDSSGKLMEIMPQFSTGNYTFSIHKWNSSTSFNATVFNYSPSLIHSELATSQPLLLKISDDGTNLAFFISIDGQHWKQFSTNQARTAFFASGPTQVFWGAYVGGTSVEGALVSWQ